MLDYVNSDKLEYISDVRNRYEGCKVLMINMDISDMENIQGIVCAVSRSRDSFDELCDLKGKFAEQGVLTMILGSYGGGFIGVQHEVRQ